MVLARDGNHILFDRQHDPDQLCNIAGSSSKAGITAELSRKIMKHNAFFSAPAYSWLADIV
ncbi:MAG: hypothetical protein A2096_15455 [Spirochaetes bacterium GWF1_41_5]|nr:MAG: hypothetical protein A2096_15455 [Spirochaetes bacterium GWF1_41_5]